MVDFSDAQGVLNANLLLKEYELVREEIIFRFEECERISRFSLTSSVGLITLMLSISNPYLSVVVVLATLILYVKYYDCTYAILKSGAYLSVCIEPFVKELNWETRCLIPSQDKTNWKIVKTVSHFEYLLQMLFAIIVSVAIAYQQGILTDYLFLACCVIEIICVLMIVVPTFKRTQVGKLKLHYQQSWQEVMDREKKDQETAK